MSVVMKFGGTSVADAEAIRRVAAIVQRQLTGSVPGSGFRVPGSANSEPGTRNPEPGTHPPVVVVSALSKVTDRLIEAAQLSGEGDADRGAAVLQDLQQRHVEVASALTSGTRRDETVAAVRDEIGTATSLVRALAVLGEISPRSLDAVVAAGELASSRIVAAAFAELEIPGTWVDARTVVVTDGEHTAAAPDMAATTKRVQDRLRPTIAARQVPVLGGFIGATSHGVTTTLGRGGSDYSAAIVGACLDADEIQIWTDVDGMLTADPRVVPSPRVVPHLSFAEASELAYFGAKVLHPSTILPAVAKNIPVRILNSRRPDAPGTLITASARHAAGELTAIACKRDVTVIDITSTRMLMAHGFLRRVFEVFERFKTAVDVVTTSEVSVSVTVDDTRRLADVVDNLRSFAEVSCEPETAIVCAVGENLRAEPALFGRAIQTLDQIPLRLVSQAASRRNVTFVLRDADAPRAMMRLHEEFFEGELEPAAAASDQLEGAHGAPARERSGA